MSVFNALYVASLKCKNNFLTRGCNRSSRKVFDSRSCKIKIFRGGGRGGGWGGGSSERCLKWGGGGVIKGSFQKHLKTGGG